MNDYIFLMHDDAPEGGDGGSAGDWRTYIAMLAKHGGFDGGSEIGDGECVNKSGVSSEITTHLVGYLLVQAKDMAAAKELLKGNPVFEAGGTIEIRELPQMG